MRAIDPNLLILALFVAGGFLFVLLNLAVIAPILRPGRMRTKYKDMAYECGEEPIGDAWIRFNPRFFLIAVVFVLFDVELAFLFPWAVAYKGMDLVGLLYLFIFLDILLAGYLWAWKRGDLRWIVPRAGVAQGSGGAPRAG